MAPDECCESISRMDGLLLDHLFATGSMDGIPVDTDLIADAYENDDFWLPPPDASEARPPLRAAVPNHPTDSECRERPLNAKFFASSDSNNCVCTLDDWYIEGALQQEMMELGQGAAAGWRMTDKMGASFVQQGAAFVQRVTYVEPQLRQLSDCPLGRLDEGQWTPSHQPSGGTITGEQVLKASLARPNFHPNECWEDKPIQMGPSSGNPTMSQAIDTDVHRPIYSTRDRTPRNDATRKRPKKANALGAKKNLPKKKAVGKDKASPVLPLSAYNFFFRVERVRLLEGAASNDHTDNHSPYPDALSYYTHILSGSTREFQEMVLQDQWTRDPTVKRKHRKSHGRISFQSLARQISQSWRHLPEEFKQVFHAISARDFERFELEKGTVASDADQHALM